jgi:ketosteroid isomerase-like protein
MRRLLLAVLASAIIAGCRAGPTPSATDAATRDSIRATLAAYMTVARTVDAAGMASFFAPNGVLFEPGIHPLVSPDSIKSFLSSFPGVKVDSATAVPDTIELYGKTALLWGSYFERLAFPGQPVSEQDGKFVVQWTQDSTGRWLIQRYYRIPLPGTRLLSQ